MPARKGPPETADYPEVGVAATRSRHKSSRRVGIVATGIGALAATSAQARTEVDIKYLHYREQDGRTGVNNPELYFRHDFGDKGQLGMLLSYDSISGASPTGETPTLDATARASADSSTIPMAEYSDTRQAITLSYSRRFGSHLPSVALSYSKESDYLARGFSLVDSWDLFGGRATLHAGVGMSRDVIEPVDTGNSFSKESLSFSAGWTQVLGPRDLLDFSIGLDRLDGYLNDPYKLVTADGVASPENRPQSRSRKSAVIKYGHYFLSRGALKTSYRYYWDDWSVDSHTIDLSYDQRIGRRFIVTPRLRYYRQGAAEFFGYEFATSQPFMTSDYRLSSFWSWLAGIGLTVELNDRLSFNIAAAYQNQTGLDRVTPRSAVVPTLLRTAGSLDGSEEDEESEGVTGTVSAADLKTITGTLGFTIKF